MSKFKYLVLIVVVVAATHGLLYAQNKQSSGGQPYTPTKLEWLVLRSTAAFENGTKVYVTFEPHPDEADTVRVQVMYDSGVDDIHVKAASKSAQRTVTKISDEYQWEWVNVDVVTTEIFSALSK